MEVDLARLLAEGSALVAAVVLMFYWQRKDAKERLEVEKERLTREEKRSEERLKREEERTVIVINALTNNTAVLSELTTLVKRLNHVNREEE